MRANGIWLGFMGVVLCATALLSTRGEFVALNHGWFIHTVYVFGFLSGTGWAVSAWKRYGFGIRSAACVYFAVHMCLGWWIISHIHRFNVGTCACISLAGVSLRTALGKGPNDEQP